MKDLQRHFMAAQCVEDSVKHIQKPLSVGVLSHATETVQALLRAAYALLVRLLPGTPPHPPTQQLVYKEHGTDVRAARPNFYAHL